jgi:stage IV sporulation protein FA
MEVKDKVRQRRMERIRELKEATQGHPLETVTRPEPLRTDPDWLRKMEDPEFAWRQRMNQEQLKYGRDSEGNFHGWPSPPFLPSFWAKLMISLALFGLLWGIFHIKQPWAVKSRLFIITSLTQSMDMKAIAAWYTERFGGAPSFIPSFQNRGDNSAIKASTEKRTFFIPLQGEIKTPFDTAHPGILLHARADAPVYALDTGQVIFAGTKEETGYTVIIRHPGGFESVYGGLNNSRVEVNDWIKGGESIGKVSGRDQESSLYFAISKNGRFINPTDVISFD